VRKESLEKENRGSEKMERKTRRRACQDVLRVWLHH